MKIDDLAFGSITIDGIQYSKDIIIDRGIIMKRKKKASKMYSDKFGHTPLSADENIPWKCSKLIIGTGHNSALPVMEEVYDIALEKGIQIITMTTKEAIKHVNDKETNLILHLTC